MEDIMAELIAVSPIAAAMIIMSVIFLKYAKGRDKEWSDTIKHMSAMQVKSHDTCSETVKENTLMMGEVKQLIQTRIQQAGEHG